MKTVATILIIFFSFQISAQDYVIKIADMPPGNVDFDRAINADGLTVEGPDIPKITRFKITKVETNVETSATSYSDKFTDLQKQLLSKVNPGSSLLVEKIRIQTKDRIIDLPSVKFRLSNYDYVDESLNLVTLGGMNSGLITKDTILNDPVLRLNSDVGTILGFTMFSNIPGFTYEISTRGNNLTHQMIRMIEQLRVGSRFIISDTKIRLYDNTTIIANDAVFKLIE